MRLFWLGLTFFLTGAATALLVQRFGFDILSAAAIILGSIPFYFVIENQALRRSNIALREELLELKAWQRP